ncbi:MAG: radical SAM protein [Synergistaceae bacterium]|nr:radical SAM protein [Synergistaceae bacterium]
MKDLVKINFYRDLKAAKDETENLKNLIANNLYPEKFLMPLTLQFELTTHCNVHCRHCYNKSGEDNKFQDAMTPENWKNFARYLVERGGIFQCIISGGEPLLLGEDLFEIMDILHDDGTSFLVISNGLLMTPDKAKRFKKYRYKWFQISIDGVNAARHDEFRQREGSFDKAVNAVFMLSSLGIPVMIAHSVTPENLHEVDDMCNLAYSLGASGIILGEIMPSGRAFYDSERLILNYEQKNILADKIENNIKIYSGRMLVQRSSGAKIQLTRNLNVPNTGAIIRPNGDIRLDCTAPFVIGNILENDFCEIWDSKAHDVWQNPKIIKYIESYEDFEDVNHEHRNYFDKDIRL